MTKEKKPKHGLNVSTDLFNLNDMKIYVQLHLARKVEDEKTVGMVNKYVTDVDAMVSNDLEEYLHIDDIMIEYSYLFMKDEWYVDTCEHYKHELQLLSDLI